MSATTRHNIVLNSKNVTRLYLRCWLLRQELEFLDIFTKIYVNTIPVATSTGRDREILKHCKI